MKLALFLVDPLPARGTRAVAVEFEVGVLLGSAPNRAFVAIGRTTEIDNLLLADGLDSKFEDLIDACALLAAVGDTATPEMHTVELEVVLVGLFELLDRRCELVFEFE